LSCRSISIYDSKACIYFPAWHWQGGWFLPVVVIFAGIVMAAAAVFLIRRGGDIADRRRNILFFSFLFPVLFLSLVFWPFGSYGRFDFPQLRTFNVIGGASAFPLYCCSDIRNRPGGD